MFLTFNFAARSDVGLVRASNQDSAFAGPQLLVVADGMGGAAGGDIASSLAIGRLAALDGEAIGPDEAIGAIEKAMSDAHKDIVDRAHNDPTLSGLGTTVTCLLRAGTTLAMAHIGDSRAYLLRDGELDQVTTDHSFVQHLVDTGRLSAADAENHPKRSMLLRVLGDIDADIPVDVSARESRPGDRWLLCSDGLSSTVSRPTIAKTLKQHQDPAACADALVALALAGGAPDNVTCVVADVVDLDEIDARKAPSSAPQIVGSAAEQSTEALPAQPDAAAKADSPAPSAAPKKTAKPKTSTPSPPSPDTSKAAAKAAKLAPRPLPKTDARKAIVRWWERVRPWALPTSVFVAVFALTFGAYMWTQQQYYVGEENGEVAIYRGIPQSVGPLEFSSLVTVTGLDMDNLDPFEQDRIRSSIQADSLGEAWEIVDGLAEDDD